MRTDLLLLSHKMLGHLGVLSITGVGLFTAVDFNHTVTLGSIMVVFIIVIVAGVFTIRSKIASIWREEAEGERAAKARIEEQLAAEKTSRALFDRQQQELRHDLKDQLAGCRTQLKAMEAKTDLTTALESIRQMNEAAVTAITGVVSDSFIEKSSLEHAETHRLLKEISSKLPSEPIEIAIHDPKT